jgi:hypothetical protein
LHILPTSRRTNTRLRTILSLALAIVFVTGSSLPVVAQSTTGTLSGTVTADTGQKLGGVTVSAVSPSQSYTTKTDANGFYSITGVSADTYTVSFKVAGYVLSTLNGITVAAGQGATVSQTLTKQLTEIGRTTAHSPASAFQPQQVQDTYTIGQTQMANVLGKKNGTDETSLLASIPGASFDSSGYPVLRGGRENEEGFQFEGIPYTDPFTNQFVNSLVLNGAGQFQVTPGAGDASVGNAGTGTINIVAKRGTRPAFGSLEYDTYAGYANHELHAEYGFATPNGRFSNYASFFGDRISNFQYGPHGTPALLINDLYGRNNQWLNDVVENAVYKFGRDNSQSLQFFYENTFFGVHLGNGFQNGPRGFNLNGQPLYYKDGDPLYQRNVLLNTPFSVAQMQYLQPLTTGEVGPGQQIGSRFPISGNQPNDTFKLQYSNNLNASTFLTLKYFEVNNVELFDDPYRGAAFDVGDYASLQGGFTRGVTLDMTKQLTPKHLLGVGGEYRFLHPVFSQESATGGFFNVAGFANSLDALDFLPANNCPIPGTCGYLLGGGTVDAAGVFHPGPGTQYVPYRTKVPMGNQSASTNGHTFAFYVQDTWSPADRLKINAGLRMDAANFALPTCTIFLCVPTSSGVFTSGPNTGLPDPSQDRFNYDQSTRTPRVLEPRLSVVDQFTQRDSLRVAYARSVQFPLISQMDQTNNLPLYTQFAHVPSRDPLTGLPARFCGTTNDRPCATYADQLYWENETNDTGVPIVPLKPTTFTNWEATYSHLFGGNVAVKLTPFYRKAFDAIAAVQQQAIVNGAPAFNSDGSPVLGPQTNTNLGNSQIMGVEFYLTKEAAYGFSGALSLTYQNEFSQILPTSPNEDFFPSVPLTSLQLGNRYRVGFLSPLVGTLAVSYRTHNGWRFNTSIFYDHGYPNGAGLITAYRVNGVPYDLKNTNVTSPAQLAGSAGAVQYVDPQNPGSLFAPNIAATRGTPEGNSAGGILSKAELSPFNVSLEFTPPKAKRNTFGVQVFNVFNNYYLNSPQFAGGIALNTRFQPVATGRGAPYSGYSSLALNPAYIGAFNLTSLNGNLPYIFGPSRTGRTAQFYYQLNF